MKHHALGPAPLPPSPERARPDASPSCSPMATDRVAEDFFAWDPHVYTCTSIDAAPTPHLLSPSASSCDLVFLSARGTWLTARRGDVPPSLLNQTLSCSTPFVEDAATPWVYVNIEASILHRVLDFHRDKKVPLSLPACEVDSLKRAAKLLDDQSLLHHMRYLRPGRQEAHDAKGQADYAGKLNHLARLYAWCGDMERAHKKQAMALAAHLRSLNVPADPATPPKTEVVTRTSSPRSWPDEEDDRQKNWRMPWYWSPNPPSVTGWVSAQSQGTPSPLTPGSNHTLCTARDFFPLPTADTEAEAAD